MTIDFRTLGSLQLRGEDGGALPSLLAQPRRVALLAYLTLAAPRGFHRRDRLVALFWPEHDAQRARNALSQAVHFLRRGLGSDAILSRGDEEIGVEHALFSCDAIAFEAAIDSGRVEEAIDLYRGPLLEGFHIAGAAPELDQWLDSERGRLARRYAQALLQVARDRESVGDHAAAALWYRRLATQDPLSAGAALALMRALAATGDQVGALRHARIHEALVREELGAPLDSRIATLVMELQLRSVAPPAALPAAGSTRRAEASSTTDSPPVSPPTSLKPAPEASNRIEASLGASGPRRSMWLPRAGRALVAVLFLGLSTILLSYGRRATAPPQIDCVAPLPLENISRDSARDYLGDAIGHAIMTELARYDRPRVISRTSMLSYRRSEKPLPQIGEELGCNGVLESSITSDGRYLRVDAQILFAPEDRPLWGEYYEGDTTDILGFQRRVAEGITRHVQMLAAKASGPAAIVVRRADPVAAGLYLRGREAFSSRNPASLRQAVLLFNQAILRDSAFAPAYAGLADSYRFLAGLGYAPFTPYVDSARMMVRKALMLDSTLSEAHASLAALFTDDGDWLRADSEFRKAIALQPGNALAHHWYAMLLATLDRRDEALSEIREAKQLDPSSQALQGAKGQIEFFAGVRVVRGRVGERKSIIDPTHPGTVASRAIGLARNHRCPEAYAESARAQELAPDNVMMQISLVAVHVLCGAPVEARTLLEKVEHRPDAPLMAVYIAKIYASQGQADSAFAWLDRARWGMQSRFELRVSPELEPLRTDTRYRRLLQRIGLS